MSEKKRQKKDGKDKNKKNQAMHASERGRKMRATASPADHPGDVDYEIRRLGDRYGAVTPGEQRGKREI